MIRKKNSPGADFLDGATGHRRAIPRRIRIAIAVAGIAIWIGGIALGFHLFERYETTPGEKAAPPAAWAAEPQAQGEAREPTLLVFAHPSCPCTRATVEELARLVTWCEHRLRIVVFILANEDGSSLEEGSSIEKAVGAIPLVEVRRDPGGAMARRFAVRTSGQCLLYSAEGELRFSGGITPARGHVGDNSGEDAILAWVQGKRPAVRVTPVFGCSLFDSERDPVPESHSP